MRCLTSLLFASVLVGVPCCGRTGLGTVVSGAGGTKAPGGIVATGGARATTVMSGTGGSPSTSVGSTSTGDLDACSSNDDCTTSCTWTTAPTDSSQCFAEYCCGSNWMSKRRCEANRAAWAIYCPNQSSKFIDCPCITMCDTPAQTITLGCVGGKCEFVCSPPVLGTGGSTAFPQASGGYTGNDGAGGRGGTGGGIVVSPPATDASVTATSGPFTAVSVGSDCACGIRVDKTIDCWAIGNYGTCEPPGGTFMSVSLGYSGSCGVDTLGTMSCWSDVTDEHGLVEPPSGTFTSVSTGDSVLCGIRTDGTVACSGSFVTDGDSTPPSGTFTAVSVGTLAVCGVRTDGTLACWGHTAGGSPPPTGTFASISLSMQGGAACGVRTDGTLACWGEQPAPPTGAYTSVSIGVVESCGVRTDGTLACWGSADAQAIPPTGTIPTGTFTSVSVGSDQVCGPETDGDVLCWPLNFSPLPCPACMK